MVGVNGKRNCSAQPLSFADWGVNGKCSCEVCTGGVNVRCECEM